jgi:hypothetical protein
MRLFHVREFMKGTRKIQQGKQLGRAKNAKQKKIKNFPTLRRLRVLRAKPAVSFPEQPQQQRQERAQNQAGNDLPGQFFVSQFVHAFLFS